MIVAIIRAGSGQVPIEEFREADSTATALTAFVNDYSTPLLEADYIAHDTGFSSVPKTAAGNRWGYDHGTGSLVEIAAPVTIRAEKVRHWESPDGSIWEETVDDTGAPTRRKLP